MTEKIKFDEQALDELIKNCKTQEDLFGEKGIVNNLLKQYQKKL